MAKGTVNKVQILGRLGQDPEVRATGTGTQVATLNIATNEVGPKDQNTGQRNFETEWHKVTLFGKNAENAATYLKKGSQVFIDGRLKTESWNDKQTGQKRYSTGIIANEMTFIGGSSNGGGNQNQQSQNNFNQTVPAQNNSFNQTVPAQPQNQPSNGVGFDDFDDDIPF